VLPSVTIARRVDHGLLRLGLASGAGGLVFLASRWPVAALFAAGVGAWLPSAIAASGRVHAEIAKVEAIATWTEQLRDTLAAANGLESAVSATARLAPKAIAGAVERLGARIEYERTTDALRRFAVEVDHPVADFVVAALVVAAEHEARDLTGLLGHLAATARDEARMRSRVWVGRARTRTSVRVIAAVVPLMVGAVMLLDRHYMDPYNSAGGQVALFLVGLVFLASFVVMERMGRIDLPERFIGRRADTGRLS
jgi:Flp pilus assembly protein TadB